MKLVTALFLVSGLLFGQQIDWGKQIKNKPSSYSSDYNFVRTNGLGANGNLSIAGSNSITISPCPAGVNGTNTNHYLYLSGGVGTAEVVLITGGTCISEATVGSIQFTTLNSHSGGWTIRSATSGIQEAVWVASPNGSVTIPSGNITLYAGVTVKTSTSTTQRVSIKGISRQGTVIVSANNFSGSPYGFLFDDNDSGSTKFEPGLYGLSSATLDFRLTPLIDIVQIGTIGTLGIGHGGAMFTDLNYWGGKRWIYSPGASDKIWVTNSYFNKATTTYDGIWVDVTTPRAGYTFSNLEIATDANSAGAGNAFNLYCNSVTDCNFTNFNMIQVLGKWRSALKADNVAIAPPDLAVGFYVLVNFWISEMYAGEAVFDLHDVAFSQIQNSWMSNFTTTGTLSAVICENCFEIRWTGNYFNSSGGAGDVKLSKGGRHMFTSNRFMGATKAFHFSTTPEDGQGSIVGYNHYRSPVHTQKPEWALFIKPSDTISQRPVLSPFSLQMDWTLGNGQMLLENIEAGAVTPKKYIGVDPEGSFTIVNNAGNAIVFRARDSGVLVSGTMDFTTLSSEFPGGDRFVRCTNCTPGTTPCTSGGSGAWAFGSGSQWKCPF